MSSPDIAPPPPCPITMVGVSRSGTGHAQLSKSEAACGSSMHVCTRSSRR